MTATIPEQVKDLLSKRAFAHLATVMPDGSPQVSPVWFDFDGTHFIVNSAKGRVKDKNMRRNKNVALSITDPHIDKLAKKYLGKDKYPFAGPGEVRVIYKIEPNKVATMG